MHAVGASGRGRACAFRLSISAAGPSELAEAAVPPRVICESSCGWSRWKNSCRNSCCELGSFRKPCVRARSSQHALGRSTVLARTTGAQSCQPPPGRMPLRQHHLRRAARSARCGVRQVPGSRVQARRRLQGAHIDVELAHERGVVVVLEDRGQELTRKRLWLHDHEGVARGGPRDEVAVGGVLEEAPRLQGNTCVLSVRNRGLGFELPSGGQDAWGVLRGARWG